MSKERTFSEDTLDMKFIRSLLGGMVDELAFDLRQDARLTSCITVKIRYADFNTFTKQRRIPYTAQTRQLITYATELFDEVYEKRQLIRLIGVKFSRSEEHTSELQSPCNLVCRLLLEKKKKKQYRLI